MCYDVFISYASNDRATATEYARILNSFGVSTWYDQAGGSDEHIFIQIANALKQSSFVLLLWSRHAAGSSFVEREIFLAEELGKKIVPVRLDNRSLTAQLRLILARTNLVDGRNQLPQRALLDLCERISPPKTVQGPAFLFLNMKGGVGKTTLAANIATTFHAAPFSKGVLLVDLDAQANLSNLLMSEREHQESVSADRSVISTFENSQFCDPGTPSPTESLFSISTSANPPKPTQLAYNLKNPMSDRRLDLIVGQFELFKYSLFQNYEKLPQCRERFQTVIAQARRQYDAVILDAAPSNSFVTECAIRAATDIVAPATPDKYALRGIAAISRLMRDGMGPEDQRPVHVLRNSVAAEVDLPEQTILDAYPMETLDARIKKSAFLQVRNADPNARVRDPVGELGAIRGRRDLKEALVSACTQLMQRYEARTRRETASKAA